MALRVATVLLNNILILISFYFSNVFLLSDSSINAGTKIIQITTAHSIPNTLLVLSLITGFSHTVVNFIFFYRVDSVVNHRRK